MKLEIEETALLAAKITEIEIKLEALEQEIDEIGEPASHDLRRRLRALKVEEHALKRNFEESMTGEELDHERMAKVGALLGHIESEERSVEHAADFLHQSAPSSVSLVVEAGAKLVEVGGRKWKKIIGNHHPFGSSVFVNRSHENLEKRFGLK